MRTPIVALLCLAPLLCDAMAGHPWSRQDRREAKAGTNAFTRELPDADSIILHRYRPWPIAPDGIPAVGDIRFDGPYAQSRRVHGSSVRGLCDLWRSQCWDLRFADPSHLPEYAITFHRAGQLVCTISVSFENRSIIVFKEPGAPSSGVDLAARRQGFNIDSQQGRALQRIFAEAFPN